MTAAQSSSCSCANMVPHGPGGVTWAGRFVAVIKWLVPGTILAIMPKCPACLAMYVAFGTGLGLSMTAARYLRTGAIVGCAAMLMFFCGASGSQNGFDAHR